MMHRCLLTIIRRILHCSLLELIHRIWLLWSGCQRHCIFILLSLPNSQQPCDIFSRSYCITHWSGAFFQSYCCFCCHFYCFCPTFWHSVAVLVIIVTYLSLLFVYMHWNLMWSISSGIAHGVKDKKNKYIRIIGGFSLNDIVLIGYLWKNYFQQG